jgi:predicted ribosomally synthesized peptide with SipW-like signal peptide
MKLSKTKVFALALAVCLIAILSMGSVAWFSDADSVTNEFMIADSADTPDEIFSVDVWENTPEGDKDQDGYIYENILPGSELKKEVYVENTGAYDQYIRVHVTINNADAWIAALGNGYDLGTIFEGHDETVWTRYEAGVYDGANNTYTMTYYLNAVLAPDATACLFETVVIPSQLTQDDMVYVGGGFEMNILAEAVQTENLGVDNAYDAFQIVMP